MEGKEKEGKKEVKKTKEFPAMSDNSLLLFYCSVLFCQLYMQICKSFLLSIFKRHHFICQHYNWNKLIHFFVNVAEWASVKHKLSLLVTMQGTVITKCGMASVR
jgi:hypothetical protein